MTINAAVTDTAWSSNYSRGRPAGSPTSITIHHWGADGQQHQKVVNYLCNPNRPNPTSAHYVASAGRVTQLVHDYDRAWHAGPSGNPRSIGIECRPEMNAGDVETVARLIAAIRSEWGHLPLLGHRQWMATACPGRWFPHLADLSARADQIASGNTTPQEDDMSRADVDEIIGYIRAVMVGGYTWNGTTHPGIGMVVEENQRRLDRTTANTLGQLTIARAGQHIPALQELADTKTLLLEQKGTLAGLTEAISQLAATQGLDPQAITRTVSDAVQAGLKDVEITLTTKESA